MALASKGLRSSDLWHRHRTDKGRHSLAGCSRRGMAYVARATGNTSYTKVSELLVLFEASQGTSPEDQQAMLEQLWSMQYCTPGVLTASGGPLLYNSQTIQTGEDTITGGFTHAVHFRFSNTTQASAFLRNSRVKALLTLPPPVPHPELDSAVGPQCVRTTVLAFQGNVESEMEALFRRGSEFASGEELVLVLKSTSQTSSISESQSESAANSFLSQLALLAKSSLAGAVQVSQGMLVVLDQQARAMVGQTSGNAGIQSSTTSATDSNQDVATVSDAGSGFQTMKDGFPDQAPCYVFMARFPTKTQLESFRNLPPVKALWQQRQQLQNAAKTGSSVTAQLPICAVAEFTMHIAPDEPTQ